MNSSKTETPHPIRATHFLATVVSNQPLCRDHCGLLLETEQTRLLHSRAGQFLQVLPRRTNSKEGPLLRRPFSIASLRPHKQGRVRLGMIVRRIGPGSEFLCSARPGQKLDIIGPLGNGFSTPVAGMHAVLVAGGVGVAPLMFLAERISRNGIDAVMLLGSRSADLLPVRSTEPSKPTVAGVPPFTPAIPTIVSTDDGSAGRKQLLSETLQQYLHKPGIRLQHTVIYACGPEKMLQAVASIAEAAGGLRCELSLERFMACGLGTCQSCVVKVRDSADPAGWRYKLCCVDGPVFPAGEIVWDQGR